MKNRLRQYREKRGLSQEALANEAGVPVSVIQDIEDGKETIIKTRAIARIAILLGAEPSEIFLL